MDIIAHRGNSGEAPENTLAAFRQVQATGAAGVEFDVHLSRDGVPVVIHGETVDRTTSGQGRVCDHSLAELQRLDAGSWFGPAFAGERIPTLRAVLDVFRNTPIQINIELKTGRIAYPGLSQQVIDLVRELGIGGRIVISSFNHFTLREARALAPELDYGMLAGDPLLDPWAYVHQHGFRSYHPRASAVDELLVRQCHALGQKVRVFTVDDPADFARLSALGVDAVFTNHPRRFAGKA